LKAGPRQDAREEKREQSSFASSRLCVKIIRGRIEHLQFRRWHKPRRPGDRLEVGIMMAAVSFAVNSSTLIASLIWGSIGSGFAIFGWKQKEPLPLFGGIALISISYFIGSALWMSLVGALILTALVWLKRRL
jgi:hypothetical protein